WPWSSPSGITQCDSIHSATTSSGLAILHQLQSTLTRRLPLHRLSTTRRRSSLRNVHLPTITKHRSRIQPQTVRPLPRLTSRLHVPSTRHSHVAAIQGDLHSPAQLIPHDSLRSLPERRPHLRLDSMVKLHVLGGRTQRPRRRIASTTLRREKPPPSLVILPLTPQRIRIRRRTTVHTRTTTSHSTTPSMHKNVSDASAEVV